MRQDSQENRSKTCPDCGLRKAFQAFPKNHGKKDGLAAYCKPCHNTRNRSSRIKNYGGSRHYHLIGRYGVSATEVQAMIDAQGGLCAICRIEPAVQVDHDHKSGKVRGILCDGCNGGLGAFDDDTELIERAIAYLERWP